MNLNNFSEINTNHIIKAAKSLKTPFYLYDEAQIIKKCNMALNMPNAYGLSVRYAMKANSTKAILNIINNQGLLIDASSLNEAKRANLAGVDFNNIILTTQEIPYLEEREDLELFIKKGLKYNVCSLRQLYAIGEFSKENNMDLSIRVHPGVGSGESATRNTGDNYSCFGVHLQDIPKATEYADGLGIKFTQVHVHIGSGADPLMWQQNIDLELSILEKYFPNATSISFGGGLKEARMPNETIADINDLGEYAKLKITEFYNRTGRKLKMEIEPGTFIVANSGYCVTNVIDMKKTGDTGLNFLILNGGMEINARPVMYGSCHPFYVISKEGKLLSSEFIEDTLRTNFDAVVVGRCCESGDSQCIDDNDNPIPRALAVPEILDYVVIGGTGAYCSSMTPFNYNSHQQIAECLVDTKGEIKTIRNRQTMEQMIQNEI